MSGSGEHQQRDLANCKLAVDGLRQSTRRLQRSLLDDLALAVVGIADQQGSSERCRYHRHGYKANELALKGHVESVSCRNCALGLCCMRPSVSMPAAVLRYIRGTWLRRLSST